MKTKKKLKRKKTSNNNNVKESQSSDERNINLDLYKTFIENFNEINIEDLEKHVNK